MSMSNRIDVKPSDNLEPLVRGSTTTSNESKTLLIIVPGAFLYPKDYLSLLNAFKDSSIHVAIAAVDWTAIDGIDPSNTQSILADSVNHAINTATTTLGFTDIQSPSPTNIFIALHSVSAIMAPTIIETAHRYTGVILMGSTLQALPNYFPSSHTFPLPLLHVLGERDGQAHAVHAAIACSHAFECAPILGKKATSLYRPFVVLPGINHASFSNGVVNIARGDLRTDVQLDEASKRIATAIIHFITAHCDSNGSNGSDGDEMMKRKRESEQYLLHQTILSSQFFSPYLEVLGRISTTSLLLLSKESSSSTMKQPTTTSHAMHALMHSYGPEMIFALNPLNASIAHPGEIAVAEVFGVEAQKKVLKLSSSSSVDDDNDYKDVVVMCTVHTVYESFINSTPSIKKMPTDDGDDDNDCSYWLFHIHCLLERMAHAEKRKHDEKKGAHDPMASVSPVYCLKLLTKAHVDEVMNGRKKKERGGVEIERIVHSMAMDVNESTWKSAKDHMKGTKIEERYIDNNGKDLSFDITVVDDVDDVDDVDVWGCTPLSVNDGNKVMIPVMVSKDGCCVGVKCFSEAWMVEYMMVGALR